MPPPPVIFDAHHVDLRRVGFVGGEARHTLDITVRGTVYYFPYENVHTISCRTRGREPNPARLLILRLGAEAIRAADDNGVRKLVLAPPAAAAEVCKGAAEALADAAPEVAGASYVLCCPDPLFGATTVIPMSVAEAWAFADAIDERFDASGPWPATSTN